MSNSGAAVRPGDFNYMHDGAQSSLFRNGAVYTERNADGSDSGFVGVDLVPHRVDVVDARTLNGADRVSLELNGFEAMDAPVSGFDFLDQDDIINRYYRECEALVAEQTGGRAFAFDHNIRSVLGKKSKERLPGGQQVQGPAKVVHGDYTLVSAPQRLRDLAQPSRLNDTRQMPDGQSLLQSAEVEAAVSDEGRFAIINVWRNIADEPVLTNPLAMCDAKTISLEDLVTFEIRYADRTGENYFAKYNEQHQFYFYPELRGDEALLLKQWDSDGYLAQTNGAAADQDSQNGSSTFAFHSAFDDLSVGEGAPDRRSIEVRCVVLY